MAACGNASALAYGEGRRVEGVAYAPDHERRSIVGPQRRRLADTDAAGVVGHATQLKARAAGGAVELVVCAVQELARKRSRIGALYRGDEQPASCARRLVKPGGKLGAGASRLVSRGSKTSLEGVQ